MEIFHNAKTVRLRSHHDKFLVADDDKESVVQDRHGGSRRARWTVELVKSVDGLCLIRFKSCYDKYLTATDEHFLLGATGNKVKQKLPPRLDSSVEWEVLREGMQFKFKTRYGNFLRANTGVPPWRNSITHDVPSRSHTQDWVFWDVEVLDVYPPKIEPKMEVDETEFEPLSFKSFGGGQLEPGVFASSSTKSEGLVIHYNVVDDDGNIVEGDNSLFFKGNGLQELTKALEETGLADITVCSRNPLNGELYPMRLDLPPNHVKLHVYVVPSSSSAAKQFPTE